ncbi:Glycoside hydrolase [Phytophthora cinnamomi]|uniref:Glycoside hydrolase n=1 Tax=Phytophthora cinnamomi TaxID=4785 RepID=UPI00355A9EFC|nr:Glycoside hydrolase [Phytophthora cinnamomi]
MFDARLAAPSPLGIDYYPVPMRNFSLNDNNIDFFTDDQEDVGARHQYLAATGANALPELRDNEDAYPACYSAGLKSRGEQIILAFAQYDNDAGFQCWEQ